MCSDSLCRHFWGRKYRSPPNPEGWQTVAGGRSASGDHRNARAELNAPEGCQTSAALTTHLAPLGGAPSHNARLPGASAGAPTSGTFWHPSRMLIARFTHFKHVALKLFSGSYLIFSR